MPPRGTIVALAAVVVATIAAWLLFAKGRRDIRARLCWPRHDLAGHSRSDHGTPDGPDGVCIALSTRDSESESCVADGGSFAGWDGSEGTSVGGLVPARSRKVEVRCAGYRSVVARLFRLPAGMGDTERVYLAYGPPRSEGVRVRVVGARGETLDSFTAPLAN
jgi:hypothetical protein